MPLEAHGFYLFLTSPTFLKEGHMPHLEGTACQNPGVEEGHKLFRRAVAQERVLPPGTRLSLAELAAQYPLTTSVSQQPASAPIPETRVSGPEQRHALAESGKPRNVGTHTSA